MSNKKMIFIFCLIYLFSIVNSLELTNICNEVNFENQKVNSFFRLKLDYSLPSIDYYLFKIEKEELKNQYDQLINDLFTEDFWINGNISNKIDNKLNEIISIRQNLSDHKQIINPQRNLIYVVPYRGRIVDHHDRANYLKIEETISTTNKINYLLKNITKLNENYLTKHILPTTELINNLNNLNSNLDEDQESAAVFRNKFINVFYNQPIVSFDGIKINRNQNMFLDFSTTSTIQYSIYIPFFDNSLQKIKSNCYANNKLPSFYHTKTNEPVFNSVIKSETTTKSDDDDDDKLIGGLLDEFLQ